MRQPPPVSVIMRSKNAAATVGQALAGLFSQTFQEFELLLVDSGSTDRTLSIVERYPCRIFTIPPDDYFPGTVLNNAIRKAQGDILVFQNSDVVPLAPTTLSRLLAAFEDPAVDAAFARQTPRPDAHTWVRRDYAASFPEEGEPPPWMTYSLPLAAMRRSAWASHPFYDAAFGSEDFEWGHRARRRGRVVRYVPEAVVMHSHNYTLRQLYGRRFIEGEADAFILEGRDTPTKMALRVAASVAHDLVAHLKSRDCPGLALTPARRAVYHWAYYRGHKLGESRRKSGNPDKTIAQQAILTRS